MNTRFVCAQINEAKKLYYQANYIQSLAILKSENSKTKKDEAAYWMGRCLDMLDKRDSSILIYNSIKPSSDFYWRAQARISITYTFKSDHLKADSLLKKIEEKQANLDLPEYLQARWYYNYQRLNYPSALSFALKNVKICEQQKDSAWIALAYIDLGMAYGNANYFEKAIKSLEYSESLQNKLNIKAFLIRTYQGIAKIYQQNRLYDKSNTYYEKLEILNSETSIVIYYTWLGLATNAIEMKDFVKAEKYIKKAKIIAKKYSDIHQMAYTDVLEANIMLAQKKYEKSAFKFKGALKVFKKINYPMGIGWCADGLAKIYTQSGNYKQALIYRSLAYESDISLKTEAKTKMIEDLNAKYETEKIEKKIVDQKNEMLEKEKRATIIIVVALILILILLLFFTFYRWEQKYKEIQTRNKFEQTTRQLESFNHTISHELRYPIIQIRNNLAKLNISYKNKEITKIEGYVEEMDNLVHALLQFSQVNLQTLNYGTVSTQSLVEDVIDEMNVPFQTKFQFQNLPTIKADVFLLRLVFINLISNAIKFSSKSSSPFIEIKAVNKANLVTFHVIDNGVGYNQAQSSTLFKLFGRLHSQKEFNGFGIGLSITKAIIEKHNGRIWAENNSERGAVFSFTISQ